MGKYGYLLSKVVIALLLSDGMGILVQSYLSAQGEEFGMCTHTVANAQTKCTGMDLAKKSLNAKEDKF